MRSDEYRERKRTGKAAATFSTTSRWVARSRPSRRLLLYVSYFPPYLYFLIIIVYFRVSAEIVSLNFFVDIPTRFGLVNWGFMCYIIYSGRLYAMERGLKIPQTERTKTTNALLVSLIKQLEKVLVCLLRFFYFMILYYFHFYL